jgi:hypothetical protein
MNNTFAVVVQPTHPGDGLGHPEGYLAVCRSIPVLWRHGTTVGKAIDDFRKVIAKSAIFFILKC